MDVSLFYFKRFSWYYYFFLSFFLFWFFLIQIFWGHPDNYIKANPLVTPSHIVPEWYFLPFFAILRSIPEKLLGVLALFASIFTLVLSPYIILLLFPK